jgi:hypothetical protein
MTACLCMSIAREDERCAFLTKRRLLVLGRSKIIRGLETSGPTASSVNLRETGPSLFLDNGTCKRNGGRPRSASIKPVLSA